MDRKTDLTFGDAFAGLLGTVAILTLSVGIFGAALSSNLDVWGKIVILSSWTIVLVVLYALVDNA